MSANVKRLYASAPVPARLFRTAAFRLTTEEPHTVRQARVSLSQWHGGAEPNHPDDSHDDRLLAEERL
jgi:hypothetical protein